MTWWDGFCWIIYLSNEKKSPWLLKFRLYIEGYTVPFANRVYYTPLWESPQKNSQDSRESNKFLCFFSWLTCYTPENGGEHIFLTYPRDPDSPCQRMIGVYTSAKYVGSITSLRKVIGSQGLYGFRWFLGGGNSNMFVIFTPKLGEDFPFWHIFFKWDETTT